MMLGTFQYAFCRVFAVFLGLVLFTDGNYNPADVSARARARAGGHPGRGSSTHPHFAQQFYQPRCVFSVSPHQISAKSVALWINTLVGVSTLFGLWALGILFRQARLHLTEQNIKAKFSCFQVSPCAAQLLPG